MSWFAGLFRPKPRPPVVVPPAPLGDIRIHCTVSGVVTPRPVLLVEDWPIAYPGVPDAPCPSRYTFTLPGTVPAHGWHVKTATGYVRQPDPLPRSGDWEGPLLVYAPPLPKARQGVVRTVGRAFVDDGGPFYPLTVTLLWALGGLRRGDTARVQKNFETIKDAGADAARVLCQVDWRGEEIDPHWPDYETLLGQLLDLAYDTCGLRLKLTLIGGGCDDPRGLAEKVCRVVNTGRRHKVLMIEAVNEGNASEADAVLVASICKAAGVPVAVGLGDRGGDVVRRATAGAGANVAILHTERTDDDTRRVRQGWDFHAYTVACDDGEPAGPASSVAEMTDPQRLAAKRTTSILCGADSYCAHYGAGVFGRAHTSSNGKVRQANLWEVPNFAIQMAAIRAADSRLLKGIGNWEHYNTPTIVDRWGGRCDKIYGARSGVHFAQVVIGASKDFTCVSLVPCDYVVYDCATGREVTLDAGLPDYLLVGTLR